MATGLEVAEVFRRHGETYRQLHEHLGRTERRVMGAIAACRTAALGGHTEYCRDCGLVRCAYNSCRNRHCPKCQGLARAEWLADRQAELLPVPYFHVVFTLPAQVAAIAFQNKATVYGILFRAAAKTLRTIAADPRHLGAQIGLVAVLHTWGQNLHHHPHVHCLVPGGGLSPDGMRWIACRRGFFLPVPVLSRLFRRLFLEHLQAAFADLSFFGELAGLADHTAFKRCLARLRRIDWVVYAKRPFAGPAQALAYLGRYTHRIRHYGFLGNGHRASKIAQCRRLLAAPAPPPPPPTTDYRARYHQLTGRSLDFCPACGGPMEPLGLLPRGAFDRTSTRCDTS
jgi:hypothetical protein